jgi:photosystem II stability/assembly factor-like uncharacterized protein
MAIQEISPAFAVASGPAGLRVSRDGGRSWAPLAAVPGPHPLGLAQFLDSRTGFVLDDFGKRLWRTTNGGGSWTSVPEPSHVQIDHVEFWTPDAGAAITRFGGVYLTTNAGVTWRPLSMPRLYPIDPFGGYMLAADGRTLQDRYPKYEYACFAPGGTGWVVGGISNQTMLVSTDDGSHWNLALPHRTVHVGAAWFGGCRGSQAWVEVVQAHSDYDLLHTSDSGRTWHDVLHIPNGAGIPPLEFPLSPGALGPNPLPGGLTLIPEPLALASASDAWLTLVARGGGIAFAATADDGQHWQVHWFAAPRHAPSAAPALPSVFPAGLPWLATTATDSRHAWVLFGSTNGSGSSYLYATSNGGASWMRIATFR